MKVVEVVNRPGGEKFRRLNRSERGMPPPLFEILRPQIQFAQISQTLASNLGEFA